ncbi:MAG: hypothetical protein ACR2IX_00140 [Limnohabitans sp.]
MKRLETREQPFFLGKQKQTTRSKSTKGTFHHLIALICTVAGKCVPIVYFWIFFNEINDLRRLQQANPNQKIVINEALREGYKSAL